MIDTDMPFENIVAQIQNMKPSWERTEQIEYLIHALDTKPDLLKKALKHWPFLVYEKYTEIDEDCLNYNYWTVWNGYGWKSIWKRFIIELGLHYDTLPEETKGYISILETKEKYGTLRVYLSGCDDDIFEMMLSLEQLSSITCAYCGKQQYDSKGRNLIWITSHWITPYCKDCLRKDYFNFMGGKETFSKDQYKKQKQKFREYAKKCRKIIPYFKSASMHNGCEAETHTFRKPAYNWIEIYKKIDVIK